MRIGRLAVALFTFALALGSARASELVYSKPDGTFVKAEVVRPGGANDTGALRTSSKASEVYDSGSVAAGAAIDSGVIDVSSGTIVSFYVSKGDATSRTPTITFYKADGTTSVYSATFTACAATVCLYNLGITATSGTSAMGMALSPKMRFVLASGGAVAARIVAYVR